MTCLKRLLPARYLALFLALALPVAPALAAVGFQLARVADPEGGAFDLAIWYPTGAQGSPQRLGPYVQLVAPDAPLRGTGLPLVLISHGSGGSLANHHDTATTLAEAGFVVAALNHAGDSTDDPSLSGTARGLILRPHQYHLALDWLLGAWAEHARVDTGRIGGFGFSAGGFTVLVAAGGVPDLRRIALHCTVQPADPSCRMGRPGDRLPPGPIAWAQDGRLRALVLAAPALGYAFVPQGLASLDMPVQLWRGRFDEVLLHPWHAEQVRYALPNPPLHAEVNNAGHYAFLAPCPAPMLAAIPEICIDPPGFDRAVMHREFNAVVLRFFQDKLR
jgi:predicted dienelactone hydrolase